ncbi:MAG: hypothetical protein RLZZ78_1119 [Armatimonadota bacterium]|jgi:phosphinothricin acetyltransferase
MLRTDSECTIRCVTDADVDALRGIYNHYVETSTATCDLFPRTAEDQLVWIEKHSENPYPGWVMECDGNVIAYASLSPFNPKPAYRHTAENSLYVHPDHTGNGYGERLLIHTLENAPKYGITNVVALITEGNDVSIRLHERHGFVPCGRIENVAQKFGKVLALILMQKQLS